ncbi:MAG TPA: autotransporter-associated beta strand repeat-containing protein [Phycisphaerae bacterium]|nr:autotransporter-associated beta strand repeat-containing protein [Phycisphaerae bacterium]
MGHCREHRLIVAGLAFLLVGWPVRVAEARSIGCGPAVFRLSFYPNDTAIIKLPYVGGSVDPEILGYYVELYDIPEGMFVSLEEDTEVRYIEVPDPSCPREGSKRWPFPVYIGRVGQGVDFGSPQNLTFGGLWPPGLPILVVALNRVEMSYKVPEIPRSSWTFTNTSPHDLVDGVVYVPGLGEGESMRYIPGLVIPAGGSLTVEGQMDSGTKWAFGGILDSPEPQPVFAFDAGGASPEGMGFPDVFTSGTDYPTTGLDAALRAHGAILDMGPRPGYIGSLEPYAASPTQFDLYSFSTGQRIGGGQQTPMLSPKAWDPGQTPEAPGGGAGSWDTVAAQWSDGAADQVWNNSAADDVVFGGSPGEVRIDEPISARSLAFHTNGYVLSGTAALTLGSGEVYVPAGSAMIAVPVAGSAGLAKTGAGTLSLTADNTYTGPTRVIGGTLAVGADIHLGDTSTPGDITIDKSATLKITSSFATRRRVIIGENGGTVDVPAGTLTLLGPEGDWGLGGTIGKLTKTGPGELKVKTVADPGRTGDVEIVAGTLSIFGDPSWYVRDNVSHLGTDVSLTIQPGGTFNGGQGYNGLDHVTINGGLLTFLRSGPDGGTASGNVQFLGLSMTGGAIVIGTDEQAGQVFCRGDVTVHPSYQTAVIRSESGTGMPFGGEPLSFNVADGPAAVDMDIQVPFPVAMLVKDGEGLLRISGEQASWTGSAYTVVRAGTLELAKLDGVTAANNLRLTGGEVRLGNPNQIYRTGKMDLAGGTFNTNGFSESLSDLTLSGDSMLDLGDGSSCILAFADSHLTDWDPAATLGILRWSGDTSGGGTERLLFGTSELGLSPDQLGTLRFINPAGLRPGLYSAAILGTGEVLPEALLWPAGDTDEDGDTDHLDYLALKASLGLVSGATRQDGDCDSDGDVDGEDLRTFEASFDWGSSGPTFDAGQVPEPGTLSLLCLLVPVFVRANTRRR